MDRKKFFKILKSIEPEPFQVLCSKLLNEYGYSASVGVLYESDEGHDLLGFTQGNKGQFVGCCTTQKENLNRKVKNDVERIADVRFRNALPIDEILIFFSQRYKIQTNLHILINELKKIIEEKKIKYKYEFDTSNLKIIVYQQSTIAQELCGLNIESEAIKYLNNLLKKSSIFTEDTIFGLDEGEYLISWNNQKSKTKLLDLIDKYDILIDDEQKDEMIKLILAESFCHLRDRPYLCHHVLKKLKNKNELIKIFLEPVCKLGLDQELDSETFDKTACSLISIINVMDNYVDGKNKFICEVEIYFISLIKELIYRQSPLLEDVATVKKIKKIVLLCSNRIFIAFTHINMKSICKCVFLPKKLQSLCVEICNIYLEKCSNAVLSLLYPIISNTLQFSNDNTYDDCVDYIMKCARKCKNTLEANWCVSAWLRINPILEQSEETYHEDPLKLIIEKIPKKLSINSPNILTIVLLSDLHFYLSNMAIVNIQRFENNFSKFKHKLWRSQISLIQIEYSICLKIAIERNLKIVKNFTKFGNEIARLKEDINYDFLQSYLFKNEVLEYSTVSKCPKNTFKDGLIEWLEDYAFGICKLDMKKVMDRNPIRALDLRGTLYSTKLNIITSSIVSNVVKLNNDKKDYEINLNFAKCTRLFKFFSKKDLDKYYNRVSYIIDRSLDEDQYSILSNDYPIAQGIYSLLYYGGKDKKALSLKYIKKFEGIVSQIIEMPRLSLSLIQLSKIENNPLDFDFIKKLAITAKTTTNLSKEENEIEDQGAVISQDLIDTMNKYVDLGSKLSEYALSLYNIANLWNMVGTTLYNIDYKKELTLECSYLYRIAFWIAKSEGIHCNKYGYNYAMTISEAGLSGLSVQFENLKEISEFLVSNEAENFYFKEDKAAYFIRYLIEMFKYKKQRDVDEIERNDKLISILNRRKWIRKIIQEESKK